MYIRADGWDDSKYVRIGNLMLPTDTSDYGNMTAEQISNQTKREYQKELDRRAEEKRKQEEAERGMAVYEKAFADVDPAQQGTDQLDTLVETLVPNDAVCDNIGAELVRAMNELINSKYDYYFYEDDGYDEYGGCAAFIADHAGSEIYDAIFNAIGTDDDSYYRALDRICGKLINYLREHPELFGQNTEDSMHYDSPTLDSIKEAAPEYEFDFDADEVAEYVERGCIDWDDFEDWVRDLGVFWNSDAELDQSYSYSFTISNISRSEYEELEDGFYGWYNDYVDRLCEEYTDGRYDEFGSIDEWAKFIAYIADLRRSSVYDALKAKQYTGVLNDLAERENDYGIDEYDEIIAAFKEFFNIPSDNNDSEDIDEE
jgi:hypothetical protein